MSVKAIASAAANQKVAHAIIAWLIVFVVSGIISAYEIGGTTPNVPWNTISYISQNHPIVAVVVSGLVAAVAATFEIWFNLFHLRHPIAKLPRTD